jgi:uncharacterized delta-60 repeat protein
MNRPLALVAAIATVAVFGSRYAEAALSSYRASFGQDHAQGAFFDITADHTIDVGGYALAADRKGRVLVLAEWTTSGVVGLNCALTRYTRRARMLDMDFSGNGVDTGDLEGTQRITAGLGGSSFDRCAALDADASSRPLVAGYALVPGNDAKAFVIRMSASGSGYDSTFSGDGRFRLDTAATTFAFSETRFSDVKATFSNRVLACGFVERSGGRNMIVARITSGGALDTTFNGTGYNEIAFDAGGSDDDACARLIELPDGKIVVAGDVATSSNGAIGVARLTSSGVLDTSFYGDGKYIISNPSLIASMSVADVRYDAGHARYLVAATLSGPSFGPTGQLMALGNTGALDESFSGDGRLAFRFSDFGGRAAGNTAVGRILMLDDGGFYVVGTHENSGSDLTNYGVDDAAVALFSANGTINPLFSSDGVAFYGAVAPTHRKVPDSLHRRVGDTLKDAIWYDGSVTMLTDTNRYPAGSYDGASHELGPKAPLVAALVTESLFADDMEFDGLAEPATEPPTISVPLGYGMYCSAHDPAHPQVYGLLPQGYDTDPCQVLLSENPALVVDRAGLWSLSGQNNAMATCSGGFVALETGYGVTPINSVFADTAGRSGCVFTIAPQELPIFNRPYTGAHLPADQPAQSFNHNAYELDGVDVTDFGQTPLTSTHTDAHNVDLYGRQHCYYSGSNHVVTGGVDEPASDIGIGNDRQVLAAAVGRVASAVPRNVIPYAPAGNDPWQREIFVRHQVGSGRYSEQFTTYYAHLANTAVRRGDVIPAKTVLGQVGTNGASSGYHLHISVFRNTNLNYLGTWEHGYQQDGFDVDKGVGAIDPWGWRAPQGIDPWAWRFPAFHDAGTGAWSINLWKAGEAPTIN